MNYKIDLRRKNYDSEVMENHLKMGGKNPDGVEINSNSRFFTRGGKPWLPVMGEFHYSRYPSEYWEEELLKIKACGIDIVASYIFWIHHEEIEGNFDWTGNKNLRRFVELCKKHDLYAYLRIGPWCHGECRNGGFPDWVDSMEGTRTNNPRYLSYAKRFYSEIFNQAKGLLYKDGGPVIGIQIENELVDGEEHLKTLKEMALEVGFDVPLYTVTGWGAYHPTKFPQHEMIPAFGDYADEPWEEHIDKLNPKGRYFYHHVRNASSIGSDIFKANGHNEAFDAPDVSHYPYVTCEIGPGVQITHHRRPILSIEDMLALPYIKLGNGSNMIGYYVFHGGSNPIGINSTTHESKEKGYPNDYPVISYDFQAPIGEFGQIKEHYKEYKYFHMFLGDFGEELAETVSVLPKDKSVDIKDNETPRFVARVMNSSGFLFFNNHQRNTRMDIKKDIQMELILDEEIFKVPKNAFSIKESEFFILPFNMDMEGVLLKYSTTQPICKLGGEKEKTWVFFQPEGMDAEYAFDSSTLLVVDNENGTIEKEGSTFTVKCIKPGMDCIIRITKNDGSIIKIITLTKKQASMLWRGNAFGEERLVITEANVIFAENGLRLFGTEIEKFEFSVFPSLDKTICHDGNPLTHIMDGIFQKFTTDIVLGEIPVFYERNKENVVDGHYFDYVYENKEERRLPEWSIKLPDEVMAGVNDVFLRINYIGDVAHAYINGKLAADCFYSGKVWDIGLKRFKDDLKESIIIKISPLWKDDWIYLEKWPEFEGDECAEIVSVEAIPEYMIEIK